MEVLQQHRKQVRNWREQLERMLSLRARIFDAQKRSWALRAHYSPDSEQQIDALHENIDNMSQEIELIREAFFGNLKQSAARARPSHALVPENPPPAAPAVAEADNDRPEHESPSPAAAPAAE